MALEHKNIVGTFPDRQHTESALDRLKASDFPMHKVSVVTQYVNSEDTPLSATKAKVQPEAQFLLHRTIERVEHGARNIGSFGGIVGLLGGAIVTLAVPGISPIVLAGARATALVGLATGVFYGAVSGAILGGAFGTNLSDEQAKCYSERLAQGQYLIVIEGTNNEVHQAETVLKMQGIQNLLIFNTI